MKIYLVKVSSVLIISTANAVAVGAQTIQRPEDFGSNKVFEVHAQPIHVKGLVHTDKTFFIWWDADIQIDQGALLGISGELRNPIGITTSIYKTGLGQLSLSGESALTGNVIVQEGSLRVENPLSFQRRQQGIRLMPGTRLEYAPKISIEGQIYLSKQGDGVLDWHVADSWAEQLGDIHGDGVLHKTGAGELRWPEQLRNNFNGMVVVKEGSLLYATLMPGSMQVHSLLRAQGGAVQDLQLLSGGRLELSGPQATRLQVRRPFTMAPDSQVWLRVWPDGRHDILQTQHASLADSLFLQAQEGEWLQEQTYTLIRADEVLQGSFSHISLDKDNVDMEVEYDSHALRLRISPLAALLIDSPRAGLRHPYNAIYSSLAQDSTELARIQSQQIASAAAPQWWAWAQHKGQHHMRLGAGDQLSRHAEWLALGYTQPTPFGGKWSVAIASIQQRWQGSGGLSHYRSKADTAQIGLLLTQAWRRWQAQAGLSTAWHRMRHHGSAQTSNSTVPSRHAHAQLAYSLWQSDDQSAQLWGRWDSVWLRPPTLHTQQGQRIQLQGQWQHQPGVGINWHWHKKSWPMPASIRVNLGWHASPTTLRSRITDAQNRPVLDRSPYSTGQRWAWGIDIQGQLQKHSSLSLQYQGSHSRYGGPDHGLGLQYQTRF